MSIQDHQPAFPTLPLRPGVSFPNWSVVESSNARDALLAIFEAFDLVRRWGGYTEAEDAVRTTILLHYREHGRPPTGAELAASSGMTEIRAFDLLHRLKQRDLVVLDQAQEEVTGAYPFTQGETGHTVNLAGTTVNAMCAVDALGAGAMYGIDTEITSACRHCGAPIHIETRDRGQSVARAQPAETVVWTGIQYEGQAATSLCTVIAFFCSDLHLEAWRAANGEKHGFRMTLDQAMETGMAIFMPALAGLDGSEKPATIDASGGGT